MAPGGPFAPHPPTRPVHPAPSSRDEHASAAARRNASAHRDELVREAWRDGGDSSAATGARTRAWSDPVRAVTRILDARRAGAPTPDTPRRPRQGRRLRPVRRRRSASRASWTPPRRWPPPAAARTAPSSGSACTSPSGRTMADIADAFGLHELAVEDAVKAEQRPKLEQFGEIDLPRAAHRPLRRARRADRDLRGGRDRPGDAVHRPGLRDQRPARRRLPAGARSAPSWRPRHELLATGPWAVAYAITDQVVDLYLEVADQVEDDLDELETAVFAPPGARAGSSGSTSSSGSWWSSSGRWCRCSGR